MSKGKRFYNVRQAARQLGKSHQTVRNYLEELDWKLPYTQTDKTEAVTVLLTTDDIEKLKEHGETKKQGRPYLTDTKSKNTPKTRKRRTRRAR